MDTAVHHDRGRRFEDSSKISCFDISYSFVVELVNYGRPVIHTLRYDGTGPRFSSNGTVYLGIRKS
jgi:hypothetical protein